MSKLIISCEDEEAIVMAMLDRSVLDNIPTDQKYNGDMAEALYDIYGYGFLSLEEEMNTNIPDYISDEDVVIWEALKTLYDTEFDYSYPENKNYVLKKR